MIRAILLSLAIASAACAQVGSVNGTEEFPPTPEQWLVVCFPDNFAADPQSQDLLSMRNSPEFQQLYKTIAVRTYTASHPDWQHRWAPSIDRLPCVILMQGDKVVYKQSGPGFGSKDVLSHLGELKGLIGQWKPFKPCPNCPGPNCPFCPNNPNTPQDDPDQPDDQPVRPNRPRPNSPLRPISPPMIPDTVPSQPATPPPAIVPPQPGPQGQPGPAGDKGPIGDKGPVGDQGKAGDKGPVGDKGAVGAAQMTVTLAPDASQVAKMMPLVYVTSTKWCDSCGQVTPLVEQKRNAGKAIKIVELDGALSGLTDKDKLDVQLAGVPAIYDFQSSRTIVGSDACLNFLNSLDLAK